MFIIGCGFLSKERARLDALSLYIIYLSDHQQVEQMLSLSLTNVPGMSAAGSCALFPIMESMTRISMEHVPPAMLELIAARCLSEQPEGLVVLADVRTGAMCYGSAFVERTEESSLASSSAAGPPATQCAIIETRAALTEMGSLSATFLRTR